MIKFLLKLFISLIVIASVLSGSIAYYAYLKFAEDLPSYTTVADYRPKLVTEIQSSDGTVVSELFEERRYLVKLSDISEKARLAFIAAEDENFYRHRGIDPLGILRAVVSNLRDGRSSQGGSTITQQLVKNLLLSREKSIKRKVREAILSFRIERRLSKDEILELYLNQIFFGAQAYGIKAASLTYFGVEPKDLSIAQGALLAGLPKAPSKYSPVGNFDAAIIRQKYVLRRMLDAGFISKEEFKTAMDEDVSIAKSSHIKSYDTSLYYIDSVRKELAEQFGHLDPNDGYIVQTALEPEVQAMAEVSVREGLRELDKRQGFRGGKGYAKYDPSLEPCTEPSEIGEGSIGIIGQDYRVYTENCYYPLSLTDSSWATRVRGDNRIDNLPLRASLEDSLLIDFSTKELNGKFWAVIDQTPLVQGAMVVKSVNSGEIIALVGGYDYRDSVFNRAVQMRRQPGSSFKPIVYLTAISQFGYTPSTLVNDTPQTFTISKGNTWTPHNFDNKYLGRIPLFRALELSRNLVSVDIANKIGIDSVIQLANHMGVTTRLAPHLSLALGAQEVSVKDITEAYGVIASGGVRYPGYLIKKITDLSGNLVYDASKDPQLAPVRVVDEASSLIMANMMTGVVTRGTARKIAKLDRQIGGKTGTTNDQVDGWFVGFTPDWVSGVWVGFDDRKSLGRQETSGRTAVPVFLKFFERFLPYDDQKTLERFNEWYIEKCKLFGIDAVKKDSIRAASFYVPPKVKPYFVDKYTGQVTLPGGNAIKQYFKLNTVRRRVSAINYLDSDL